MQQGAKGKGSILLGRPSAGHRLFYGDDPRVEAKMKERERRKFSPRLQELMYGKKYILPNYRQEHYYSQDIGNRMAASSLLVPLQEREVYDDVANAATCNVIQATKHGRPQLWLERELGEALIRGNLPEDMVAEDIHWRWPGFRVHLPKGLLRLKGEGPTTDHDLMFLDICLIPAETRLSIPEPYASEITALAGEYGWPDPKMAHTFRTTGYKQTALMISGNLNGEATWGAYGGVWISGKEIARGDLLVYAVVKPFDEAIKLGEIRRITNTDTNLSSPYEVTVADNQFCERMLHLALQTLMYLGALPLEYQREEPVLRKPKLEGKHSVPGLYAARFVGASQIRPVSGPHDHGEPTGRHLPAHWRAGHWTRQPFGPKRAHRKLIWIMPYQTFGQDEQDKRTVS